MAPLEGDTWLLCSNTHNLHKRRLDVLDSVVDNLVQGCAPLRHFSAKDGIAFCGHEVHNLEGVGFQLTIVAKSGPVIIEPLDVSSNGTDWEDIL